MDMEATLIRAVYNGFTLYMLAILLRWFGPWIQLEVEHGWLRIIPRVTDPVIQRVRYFLPEMGPIDLGPFFALLIIWMLRHLSFLFLLYVF